MPVPSKAISERASQASRLFARAPWSRTGQRPPQVKRLVLVLVLALFLLSFFAFLFFVLLAFGVFFVLLIFDLTGGVDLDVVGFAVDDDFDFVVELLDEGVALEGGS